MSTIEILYGLACLVIGAALGVAALGGIVLVTGVCP